MMERRMLVVILLILFFACGVTGAFIDGKVGIVFLGVAGISCVLAMILYFTNPISVESVNTYPVIDYGNSIYYKVDNDIAGTDDYIVRPSDSVDKPMMEVTEYNHLIVWNDDTYVLLIPSDVLFGDSAK